MTEAHTSEELASELLERLRASGVNLEAGAAPSIFRFLAELLAVSEPWPEWLRDGEEPPFEPGECGEQENN